MRILIEPIIGGKPHGVATQGKTIKLQLKITNLENTPSTAFSLTNIRFASAQGQDISNDCDNKSFSVRTLNPQESEVIDVGEWGLYGYGLISIQARLDGATDCVVCQKDFRTSNISDLRARGLWNDFVYIQSGSEAQQNRTNSVMIWLTTLLVFIAVMQLYKLFEVEIDKLLANVLIVGFAGQLIASLAGIIASVATYGLLTQNKTK